MNSHTSSAAIDAGAHQAATGHNALAEPTAAQRAAGNYRLGRIVVQGLRIAIENPRGTYREGVDADGTAWRCRMAAHYGYLSGTRGADGDGVDVFVGPAPESPRFWVINQVLGGQFDEHKVMLGFVDEAHARATYLSSYSPGWQGLGDIVPVSLDQLRWWLRWGDMARPLTPDQLPHAESESTSIMDRVTWTLDAQPHGMSLGKLLYNLRTDASGDPDLLMDAVTMDDLMQDPSIEQILMLDALVVEVGMMQRKMEQLNGLLLAAGQTVKPTGMEIGEPVRARGVLQIPVLFAMSDGQTLAVWFHNPDTTPAKLTPMDVLTSWKWQINKKDVTIVVAPERGADLQPRVVARRIMALVEKNSPAFLRANARTAEKASQIEALKGEVAGLEGTLAGLNRELAIAKEEKLARDAAKPAAATSGRTVDLGNNESRFIGVSPNPDGTFTAMTGTASKTFKTLAGAQRWIDQRGQGAAAVAAPAAQAQAAPGLTDAQRQSIGDEIVRTQNLLAKERQFSTDTQKPVAISWYESHLSNLTDVLNGRMSLSDLAPSGQGPIEDWDTTRAVLEARGAAAAAAPEAGVAAAMPSEDPRAKSDPILSGRAAGQALDNDWSDYQRILGEEVAAANAASAAKLAEVDRLESIMQANSEQMRSIRPYAPKATASADVVAAYEAWKLLAASALQGLFAPQPAPSVAVWAAHRGRAESLGIKVVGADTAETVARIKAEAAAKFKADSDARLAAAQAKKAESSASEPPAADLLGATGPASGEAPVDLAAPQVAPEVDPVASAAAPAAVTPPPLKPLPPRISSRVTQAIESLNDAKSQLETARTGLDENPKIGGGGRYESEVWKKVQWRVARANDDLQMLRDLGNQNGQIASLEALITSLGGVPDVKPSEKALAWTTSPAVEALATAAPPASDLPDELRAADDADQAGSDKASATPIASVDINVLKEVRALLGGLHQYERVVFGYPAGDRFTFFNRATDVENSYVASDVDAELSRREASSAAGLLGDAPQAFQTQPVALTPEGAESKVKTAKGTEVVTGYTVVEADSLITSHNPATGDANPAFPAELQPRDRGRDASIAWVRKTAQDLDPDLLGKSRRADSGAPIVGPDGVVESGNGRTMAVVLAYQTSKADDYRAWLESEASYFGLSPEKVKGMRRPVLVRVRTSQVDRAAFAVEANQDDKLAMTATEVAKADANRLTDDVVALMTEDGDLTAAANVPFLAAFLRTLGDAEAARYSTSDGKPTASLIARVQAAIFAKAYQDDRLLELTADVAKPEIANIVKALNHAAPEFIQAAALDPSAAGDATSKLTDAVENSLNQQAVDALLGASNVIRQAKEAGQTVDEFVKQSGLFGDIDPDVAAMAVFISQNNRSAKRMGEAFKAMATFIKGEVQRRQTADMFGDGEPVDFKDIVAAANRELERLYGEGAQTIGLFEPPATEPAEPAQAAAAEPEPSPAEAVDAVYRFDDATDEFKASLADSVGEADYSPFTTAVAIDQAVKERGGTVSWALVPGAILDSAPPDEDDDDDDGFGLLDGVLILDGDFKGHPFRGNQYGRGSGKSSNASRASREAKRAERKAGGHDRVMQYVHSSAAHAHKQAAKGAKGKTLAYHTKMAKFHAKRAEHHQDKIDGKLVLDSAALAAFEAEAWPDAALTVMDSAAGGDPQGVIRAGGKVLGRAVIGGDGKAMIYVGAKGKTRVTNPSGATAIWGEYPSVMVEGLFAAKKKPAKAAAIQPATPTAEPAASTMTNDTPAAMPAEANPARAADMDFLRSIIAKTGDYTSDATLERMESLLAAYEGDAEVEALAAQAADVVQEAIVSQAQAVMSAG